MTAPNTSSVQLLLYRFGPEAEFEGRLGGALERLESGGAVRILDALFLLSDAATGELAAIELRGHGAGGMAAPLLEFRLDASARRRATARALGDRASGIPGATLRELGNALAPGTGVVAVLVDHVWRSALEDAVARTGGTPVSSDFVAETSLAELLPTLTAGISAAGRP